MCGIAGFTTLGNTSYCREEVIRSMTRALAHRGPDGEGFFQDAGIVLGHRRLAIIDPTGGRQPMSDHQGRYELIYNGEIYNYLELREKMEERGHNFKTHSDAEVVLECLAQHGVGALNQFEGMFALALWDRQKRSLLLARDRLGIKPLYFARHDSEMVFASEVKSILLHPRVTRRLNHHSVNKYFTYGYVPAPNTIFDQIEKLEPGSWLEFDAKGMTRHFYWDLPLTDNPVSPRNLEECCEELLQLMKDSVRRQLRSDVPVGVFLSGGIDSSAITALAARESSAKLHSFSIGFDQPSYDESGYARRVAELFGTEHHEEILTLNKAAELFPEVMRMLDEPFADASIIPTYFLSQLASRQVKVVLGGDGSDELFAGYPSFQAHKVVEQFSFLPAGCRDWLDRLAKRLPVSHRYASLDHLSQQFLKGLGMSPEVRFFLWMGYYGNPERKRLFSRQLKNELQREDPFEDLVRHVQKSGLTETFQRLQYLCVKLYFQDDILAKIDRASMAHSLEVRVPYTDKALLDFAGRIQPFYKLHGLTTKYVLKRTLKGLLPPSIIRRRKAGFMMPVALWLNRSMRNTINDLCSTSEIMKTGLFDPTYVRQLLDEHFQGRRDHRKHIYALLCFMAWHRNHGA